MKTSLQTNLKCLLMAMVLLSGCRICMVCTGLSQEPCKSALPHVRPLLDSLYARHFHVRHWGVENCSYNIKTGNLTLITIPNPAQDTLGITLVFDTGYIMKDVHYPKGIPYKR